MICGGTGSDGRRAAEVCRGWSRGGGRGNDILELWRTCRVEWVVASGVTSWHDRLGSRGLVYPAARLRAVDAPVIGGGKLLLAGHTVVSSLAVVVPIHRWRMVRFTSTAGSSHARPPATLAIPSRARGDCVPASGRWQVCGGEIWQDA